MKLPGRPCGHTVIGPETDDGLVEKLAVSDGLGRLPQTNRPRHCSHSGRCFRQREVL